MIVQMQLALHSDELSSTQNISLDDLSVILSSNSLKMYYLINILRSRIGTPPISDFELAKTGGIPGLESLFDTTSALKNMAGK